MRTDSSFGIRNYTQVISGSSATPLLTPTASGVAAFPSPLFPLTTTTYPVGLFISIPRDSTASFDGHPFEVQLSATISGTVTTNVLVNLFQASLASWKDGPYAASYTLGTLGTGCTNVVTGTATAGITASNTVNVYLSARFIYTSATKTLAFCQAAQYINGAVVPIAATGSITTIASFADVNFLPQFTFASGGTNTVTITEFTISRV